LAADVPVVSCYEAGREGFWLHRWLVAHSVQNLVVDSSSIEVCTAIGATTTRMAATDLTTVTMTWHGPVSTFTVSNLTDRSLRTVYAFSLPPRSHNDPLTPRLERIKQLANDLARAHGSETSSTRALADAIIREANALAPDLRRPKR
jgi:hypothetical protein